MTKKMRIAIIVAVAIAIFFLFGAVMCTIY